MAKTDSPITDPAIDVDAAQKAKLSQDVQETRAAQAEAATETVPGDQLPTQPVNAERGEPVVDEDGELLARIQDPHAASRPEVKTALFRDAYGNVVRAAITLAAYFGCFHNLR